jgi:hypothetical protein
MQKHETDTTSISGKCRIAAAVVHTFHPRCWASYGEGLCNRRDVLPLSRLMRRWGREVGEVRWSLAACYCIVSRRNDSFAGACGLREPMVALLAPSADPMGSEVILLIGRREEGTGQRRVLWGLAFVPARSRAVW